MESTSTSITWPGENWRREALASAEQVEPVPPPPEFVELFARAAERPDLQVDELCQTLRDSRGSIRSNPGRRSRTEVK